jgi:hypothetical protein
MRSICERSSRPARRRLSVMAASQRHASSSRRSVTVFEPRCRVYGTAIASRCENYGAIVRGWSAVVLIRCYAPVSVPAAGRPRQSCTDSLGDTCQTSFATIAGARFTPSSIAPNLTDSFEKHTTYSTTPGRHLIIDRLRDLYAGRAARPGADAPPAAGRIGEQSSSDGQRAAIPRRDREDSGSGCGLHIPGRHGAIQAG